MNLHRFSIVTMLLAFTGAASSALADTVNYSFSGFGTTATFSLPSNPTPSVVGSDYFQINDVMVDISGLGTFTGNVEFFDTAAGGGAGSGVNVLHGPALFGGSVSDPTMLTGSFMLSGTVTPDSDGAVPVSGTLVASSTPPPVPEPSSGILFLTGVGTVAGALALRRRAYMR